MAKYLVATMDGMMVVKLVHWRVCMMVDMMELKLAARKDNPLAETMVGH